MSRRMAVKAATCCLVCVVSWSSGARAYDAALTASFETQGYQVRDARGRLWNRRRLDAYLGLSVWNLLPEPSDPAERRRSHVQAYFTALLRVGADVGDYAYLDDDLPLQDQEWPTGPKVDFLYGYLTVTGLLRGWGELKVGRLFQWTDMDALLFDGLLATLKTPWGWYGEVWGGRRVNGALAIDAPIYYLDGVDARDEPEHWEPTVGVALGGTGHRWRFRFAYRKTFSWVSPSQAAAAPSYAWPAGQEPTDLEAWAVSEERVSAWLEGGLVAGRLRLFAGLAYSLLTSTVARARAGGTLALGPHRVTVEVLRHEPDFDGDSIFNVFNFVPFWAANAWYELRVGRRWSGYVRGTLGVFEGEGWALEDGSADPVFSPGAGLGVRYLGRTLRGRVDWYYQDGYGGRVFGADLFWQHDVLHRLLSWEGRVTVAHWADEPAYAKVGGVGAGLAAGVTWRLHPRVSLSCLLEDNFGDFYDAEFRVWFALSGLLCTQGACRYSEVSW